MPALCFVEHKAWVVITTYIRGITFWSCWDPKSWWGKVVQGAGVGSHSGTRGCFWWVLEATHFSAMESKGVQQSKCYWCLLEQVFVFPESNSATERERAVWWSCCCQQFYREPQVRVTSVVTMVAKQWKLLRGLGAFRCQWCSLPTWSLQVRGTKMYQQASVWAVHARLRFSCVLVTLLHLPWKHKSSQARAGKPHLLNSSLDLPAGQCLN